MKMTVGICEQCQDSLNGHMVILPNKLWLSIAQMKECICHFCIEQRLGRKLTEDDFPAEAVECYSGNQMIHLRTVVCNKWFFDDHRLFQGAQS